MDMVIIIPVLNEEEHLPGLLSHLRNISFPLGNIVLVDGGSTDNTIDIARSHKVKVIRSKRAGRALQMNLGANAFPEANVYYFLHCDALPPRSFVSDIQKEMDDGADLGAFRFQFDRQTALMHFNAYMTRFKLPFCRGGDQSLFIKRNVFDALGGFNEAQVIMEDYDILRRAKNNGYKFHLIQKDIIVSSRKYVNNSYLRVQFANMLVYGLYSFGANPIWLKELYSRLLH